MAQVDFFASTPRRHTSRSNLKAAVQTTVQFTRAKRTPEVSPVAPTLASSSRVDLSAEDAPVRSSSRSLKKAFRSPFSRSAPSSPERSNANLPELPTELRDNVAALKKKEESAKPSKKSKAPKEAEVRMHANSKNHRPVPYTTAVQLNMLLEGGSQDYWLNKARPAAGVGEEEDVAEVGGFKDENGQIWWDMEEKAEWTSLLPKDSQGVPVNQDMWVEFNTDYRRSSTSSDHSTLSSLSIELAEEVDGPIFYGDADSDQARVMYGLQKPTGTVLFPVDMGEDAMSSDAAAARAIIRQANGLLSKKQGVLINDGFEDHFLSFDAEDKGPRMELSFEPVAPTGKVSKKGGILKTLWGSKHAARQ